MSNKNQELVINQRVSWRVGDELRSGYVTALLDSYGRYAICADAGEMQYIPRNNLIAHDCDRYYRKLTTKTQGLEDLIAVVDSPKLKELLNWINQTKPEHMNPRIFTNKDKVTIQFWGWAIVLLPDGTWYPEDTSG